MSEIWTFHLKKKYTLNSFSLSENYSHSFQGLKDKSNCYFILTSLYFPLVETETGSCPSNNADIFLWCKNTPFLCWFTLLQVTGTNEAHVKIMGEPHIRTI